MNNNEHSEDITSQATQNIEELAVLQAESLSQNLPEQKVVFPNTVQSNKFLEV